ncbi:MAG: transposase, partial [Bacillota bacterium]|nr:transposase [Bacillota bacterium]
MPRIMARPLRIEYAGALYHVMARGNQGHSIFADDKDRSRFLETLGEACEKTGWAIHAYVLMGNHYHFMKLKARLGGIVAGKKRESHSGGAKRAHGQKAAEELLKVALEHLGVSQRELQESPK